MNNLVKKIKYILTVFAGAIWGGISVFWVGYSIITLGNLMEDAGSYDYMENESMRVYGLIGLVFYLCCILFILIFLGKKKDKRYLYIFLPSMLAGGICTFLYLYI